MPAYKIIDANIKVDTRPLIKALEAAPADIRKAVSLELARAAGPILAAARANAPRRTGKFASSLRIYRTAAKMRIAIGSTHPAAGVLEFAKHPPTYAALVARWGPPARVIIPAIEAGTPAVVSAVDDALARSLNQRFGN